VPGPGIANPKLLDVVNAIPARGEAPHLLLGLGVVEAKGKVGVEEDL
jgi:hypothetical protein